MAIPCWQTDSCVYPTVFRVLSQRKVISWARVLGSRKTAGLPMTQQLDCLSLQLPGSCGVRHLRHPGITDRFPNPGVPMPWDLELFSNISNAWKLWGQGASPISQGPSTPGHYKIVCEVELHMVLDFFVCLFVFWISKKLKGLWTSFSAVPGIEPTIC